MKLVGLHDISYKEKKMLVSSICQMYKRLNAVKQFVADKQKLDSSESDLNDKVVDLRKEYFKSSSLFETIIGLLSSDHAMVIKNEFLEELKNNWYEQYWSRTTYFNIKKAAIDSFLFLLYV